MWEEWCKWFVAAEESCRTIASQVNKEIMHFLSVHTRPLAGICINIELYTQTRWYQAAVYQLECDQNSVSHCGQSQRDTVVLSPVELMVLVLNMGTNHTPMQWPPTSASSIWMLDMWTSWQPACFWPTDWFPRFRVLYLQTSMPQRQTLCTNVCIYCQKLTADWNTTGDHSVTQSLTLSCRPKDRNHKAASLSLAVCWSVCRLSVWDKRKPLGLSVGRPWRFLTTW